MTELEKIAYAKSFIDNLASGINPLDGRPIPEGDLTNNVRISRCFFYVSDILRQVCENGGIKKQHKKKKAEKIPFAITREEFQNYECSSIPITSSAIARKINFLVSDIRENNMQKISYKKIDKWMENIGMIEWREWTPDKMKKFPTADDEDMGLIIQLWENYGRRYPVIYYTESAQKFVIDNIYAIIETEVKKAKNPNALTYEEEPLQ